MGCGTSRSSASRVIPDATHHPQRGQGTSVAAQEPVGGGPGRPAEPASEQSHKVEKPGCEVSGVGQEGEGLIKVESVGSVERAALSAAPTEKPDSEAQLPVTSPAVVSPDQQANQAKPEEEEGEGEGEEPVKPRESLVEQTPVEPLNLSEVAGDDGNSEQQATSGKEKEGEEGGGAAEEGRGAAESEDKAEKSSPIGEQKDAESSKSVCSATEKTVEKPSDKPEDEPVKDAETSKEGSSDPQEQPEKADKEEGREEEGEGHKRPPQTDKVVVVDHRTGQSQSSIVEAVEKSGAGTGDAPADVAVKGEGSQEGEEPKKGEGSKEAPKGEEITASS